MGGDNTGLDGTIGWWGAAAAAIGLVVASTTFAGDFNGYRLAGPGYVVVLLVGFVVNVVAMLAYAELTTMFSRAGQIFEFTKYAFAEYGHETTFTLASGIGTTYWIVFGLVFAAEVSAGAHAMTSAFGIGTVTQWIVAMNLFAIVVNLFGLRLTLFTETLLVVVMIGIRVAFGVAAFTGFNLLGRGGNLAVLLDVSSVDVRGLFAASTLGVWAFIGLEFATPLVEEMKRPAKNLPKGMIVGAIVVLGMALVMGLGIITTYSPMAHPNAYTGNAPQIRIAGILFGPSGRALAGIASFVATMGSLLIAYAAIPRVLFAMARDGAWPKPFRWVHPRFTSPWPAILATGVIFLVPVVMSNQVVPLIHAAAAVWLLIYVWVLALAIKLKFTHPDKERPFSRHVGVYLFGIASIFGVFYVGYRNTYNLLALALVIFVLGFVFSKLWYRRFRMNSTDVGGPSL